MGGGIIQALLAGQDTATVLGPYYAQVSAQELAQAYSNVARGLAVVEEHPRGTLGAALRRHLDVITAEQARRQAT